MVKTRRIKMSETDNTEVKKKSIPKGVAKKSSNVHSHVKGKIHSPSIEEMIKLCRPITVSIRRCDSFDTPKIRVEGKFLT